MKRSRFTKEQINDLHMPNCDGTELPTIMRQLGTQTPVILITSDDEAARSFAQRGIPTLHKSAALPDILEAISRALQGTPRNLPAKASA